MALPDVFHIPLPTARSITFSTISLLCPLALTVAFSHALISTSISMVFVDRTLLSYSIVLPLSSQVYLSLEYALRSLREDEDDTLTNQIVIIFSTLMSFGWIVNTAFWTHCELYATNIKVCPLKIRQLNPVSPFSTAKVALGSTITVFFVIHTGFSVQELREKRQLVGNGGLLVRANVNGDRVQEVVEDDGNSDSNLFHQDPVIPSKICV